MFIITLRLYELLLLLLEKLLAGLLINMIEECTTLVVASHLRK